MEKASWRRNFLALYLDFILFGVITYYLGVIIFDFPKFFSDFVPVALALLSFFIASRFDFDPGRRIMSIDAEGNVSSDIRERGNWLIVLLGVLFVLDGAKSMIRWHQFGSELPYFGLTPDPKFAWLVAAIWGGFYIYAGIELLLVRAKGFYLAITAVVGGLLSAYAGGSIWDNSIAETLKNRRAAQRIPVKEGEIEIMQSLFPEVMIVVGLVLLAALFVVRTRLTNNSELK